MSPVPFSPITVPPNAQNRYPQLPILSGSGGMDAFQPQGQFGHGGLPLGMGVPTGLMPSSVTATTAEIVANQSQDYVDEQLAEFQAQIMVLQGKKALQKKAF